MTPSPAPTRRLFAAGRSLALLPCGRCGARGPHGHLVVRERGASALCKVCADAELLQHARQD